MGRLLLLIVIFVAACGAPGKEAGKDDHGGTWSYASGPHGESCLFYSEGSGQTHTLTMSCDSVRP